MSGPRVARQARTTPGMIVGGDVEPGRTGHPHTQHQTTASVHLSGPR